MGNRTARLALPLIEPGQAQKELTHNEALVLLDAAVQAAVTAVGIDTPPSSPVEGQGWIVGTAPDGAWTGHAQALAVWTAGGWRFVAARAGLTVWDLATQAIVRFQGVSWTRGSSVAVPAGGATIDAEARATIAALIATLRGQGLLGS